MTGAQLEDLLTRWGNWSRSSLEGAEGYPRDTVIGKFRRDGIPLGIGRSIGPIPEPDDPQFERIERAMQALQRVNADWADTLILSYVWDQSHALVGQRLKCSYSVARDRLERGRAFIAGAIYGR